MEVKRRRRVKSLIHESLHPNQPRLGPCPPGPTPPGPVPPGPPRPGATPPGTTTTQKAKTFYGSADVTPATAKVRLVQIAE